MSRIGELLAKRATGPLLRIEAHELDLLRMEPLVIDMPPPVRRGRPTRDDRAAQMLSLYEAGADLRETGRALGISHETVRVTLLKLGVDLLSRRGRPARKLT